jgi:hypothetical protein
MENDINSLLLMDSGLVVLIIGVSAYIKKKFNVPKRYVPLIPWIPSLIFAALVVIKTSNGFPGIYAFICSTIIETFKLAFGGMGLFKIYKTTVRGD